MEEGEGEEVGGNNQDDVDADMGDPFNETKRAEEREEREQATETCVAICTAAAETNLELTNEFILSSRQKPVNSSGKNLERKIKMLERKIKMMERHQKIFRKKHGAAWYEQKLYEFLEALLAFNVEQDVEETITPRKDDKDDRENNTGSSVPLPTLPPSSVAAI
jgi:hypothetical protein